MARKRKLPFVVQPRFKPIISEIGSELSGTIEIQRFGYLTVAEKAFVQTALSGDSGLSGIYAISAKIARETGRTQASVFRDIADGQSEYLADYNEPIAEAAAHLGAYQEKQALVQATCLLLLRVDSKWTIDDTMELHPDILGGLVALYEDEDAKSIEAFEAAETEESGDTEEGKS